VSDFLLELRSEEIPARMQVKAKDDLARLFAAEIAKAGLVADSIETFATPRRLGLIARGLPDATQPVSEETKGPKASAPPQALEGFLRKTGLTREQLTERDGVLFAVFERAGRPTANVLAEAIPAVVRGFPWPKSMRWGDASHSTESLRWVRPLQGIVALFGGEVVPCAVDGIVSGRDTTGHRFHHSGAVTIADADSYVKTLRAAHVIVHFSERCALIRDGARAAALNAGLVLVEDEGLVVENAGLTEWPVPLLGRFDAAFLDVPREVIQLTMRTNQKYFACSDADGGLTNAFVCTANIAASDGGAAIITGNRKVLAARLSDAKFFWENDLKVPLADQAAKLGGIVFHEKLGTVADKVERVAKLARWLVESGVVRPSPPSGGEGQARSARERGQSLPTGTAPAAADGPLSPNPSPPEGVEGSLAALAEQAAQLCKADLVTGMVGEFPELQGIIGGHIARAQGLPDAVADAIRDHYKPVGQGDDVPTAPVTVAVSLADKLDTLVCFFDIGEKPTGSRDPFALRRSALALLKMILENGVRCSVDSMLFQAGYYYFEFQTEDDPDFLQFVERHPGHDENALFDIWAREQPNYGLETSASSELGLIDFIIDRLKVQQREAGVRHDLIDAVFALGGEDDLVRLLARVKALQGFVTTAEGADLLAGYKRAANILKKEGVAPSPRRPGLDPGPGFSSDEQGEGSLAPDQVRGDDASEESTLIAALDAAEPRAAAAIAAEDFETAMSALASLRAPIDAFFENVTVNDPDQAKRTNRLALLARFRDAVHRVADFSKIEG